MDSGEQSSTNKAWSARSTKESSLKARCKGTAGGSTKVVNMSLVDGKTDSKLLPISFMTKMDRSPLIKLNEN